MIIDVTGTTIIPGNNGEDCPGNVEHYDENGALIEMRCDECDYYICCMTKNIEEKCAECQDVECPRTKFVQK